MDFKEELPVWENEGVAPPKSKQEEGWKAGDKPPAAWFNWMQNRTYKSLQELRSKAQELGIDTDDIRYDVTELEKRINAELNKKADKSDVDTKLDKKADTSYVDDKISNIDINQFDAIYKGRHSFDTLKEPGVYRLWDSNTSPSRDIDDYITVVFSESAHTIQVAYSMITDSQRENRVYTRYSYLSSWTSWRELTNVEIEEELKTKANKEHTHSANDITETVNRKFISLADKLKIDDIDDKADKSYVDTEIGKVPKVFHDKSIVTESRNPSWFDTGITICNQNTRDSFPTINEFGVSITFKGESSNYGQIFITANGDIWSRRSNSSSSWRSWYSAKQEIDKKADTSYVDDNISRTSTIVIANHDSHESSKKGADVVINRGENAATKINDAIQSLKGTGGEVKLMEGKYQLNSKISILVDNITLTGVGKATELIANSLPSGSNGSLVEVGEASSTSNNQVRGCTISNLIVNGNNTRENYRGIGLWRAVKTTIFNVKCSNNNSNGIQLSNNSSATISNVECSSNVANGIIMFKDSSATIFNVKCSNNNSNGIGMFDNSSATISNVECRSNMEHGIRLSENSSAKLSSNTSHNNGGVYCDIAVQGGSHIITNNYLGTTNNTSGWGIYIWEDSVNSVVANNVLIDDYKQAMVLDKGKNTITELSGNVGV